jgi:hypothetical protein
MGTTSTTPLSTTPTGTAPTGITASSITDNGTGRTDISMDPYKLNKLNTENRALLKTER